MHPMKYILRRFRGRTQSPNTTGFVSRAVGVTRLSRILACSTIFMSATLGNSAESKAPAVDTSREQVAKIVAKIQRADYEGDRAALNGLYDGLVPFVDEPELASRVRYWRGFAKWRRAINGFGETPTPKDLSPDLTEAESEFDAALQRDPGFVDAKVGAVSCMFNRLFMEGVFKNEKDPQRLRETLSPASTLLKEAKTAAPDNPRLLWVVGPNQWSTPPERGGGQDKAIATYQKGLDAIQAHKESTNDPLEPTWGEPELMMSLAWSNLNRTPPDLKAAEQYAQAALRLVPYWHYVRDILMPQIREAQAKQTKGSIDRHAIEELHKRDGAATKIYDVDTLISLRTDNIVALPPGGAHRGKAAASDQLRDSSASNKNFETLEYA
jgi:hypothetical protein